MRLLYLDEAGSMKPGTGKVLNRGAVVGRGIVAAALLGLIASLSAFASNPLLGNRRAGGGGYQRGTVNYAQGLRSFFITDDNFARNKILPDARQLPIAQQGCLISDATRLSAIRHFGGSPARRSPFLPPLQIANARTTSNLATSLLWRTGNLGKRRSPTKAHYAIPVRRMSA